MTTALRLPDAFTPGTTRASAATPTCSCCCCCCCAVSAVSATVALPAGFARDVAENRPGRRRDRRSTVVMVLLGLLPALLIAAGFGALPQLREWELGLALLAVTGGAASFGLAAAGNAPAPWRSTVRLALWSALAMAEFFVAGALLLGLGVGGVAVYGIVLVTVPVLVFGLYRRRR